MPGQAEMLRQCVRVCMLCVFVRVSSFYVRDGCRQTQQINQLACRHRVFTLFDLNLLKYENIQGKQTEFTESK